MGRINITRTRSLSVHPELDQTLKVVKVTLYRLPKPLRLWVAPSTVTGGYLSTSSSFDSVKEKQSSRTHSHLQLHIS
ncbi:hypothetical protein BHE74_00049887 [Ensete ventricosum]|nr:hypothetical protein BHE74_00049887 [Ensete ventricosum]